MTHRPEPICYVAADPAIQLPLTVKLEMRAAECGVCAASVKVHSGSFANAQQTAAMYGLDLLIHCQACAEGVRQSGPVNASFAIPADWKKHFAHE